MAGTERRAQPSHLTAYFSSTPTLGRILPHTAKIRHCSCTNWAHWFYSLCPLQICSAPETEQQTYRWQAPSTVVLLLLLRTTGLPLRPPPPSSPSKLALKPSFPPPEHKGALPTSPLSCNTLMSRKTERVFVYRFITESACFSSTEEKRKSHVPVKSSVAWGNFTIMLHVKHNRAGRGDTPLRSV